MSTPIYSWYLVHLDFVEIKFLDTISTPTLTVDHFSLYDVNDTLNPVLIPTAFKAIDVIRDYYSISRSLNLWFNISLSANSNYEIRISGLKTITSQSIDNDAITFSTGSLDDLPLTTPPNKIPQLVDVQDYSIKNTSLLTAFTIQDNISSSLQITSVNPDSSISYYLKEDEAEGKIEIYFNEIPAANFISSDYFKVFRKEIKRGIARWEIVNCLVTSDPEYKIVVIFLPSLDAVPVYGLEGYNYWETGFKYKLHINGDIGI